MRWTILLGALVVTQAPPRLTGDWQARAGDEIRHIMVRSDSSAQFGHDLARWRVVGDSLWITLGDGVWQVYGMKLGADRLTLAGGDLEKPVTLRRGGAPKAGSGERRVGEECRSRWAADHLKKKKKMNVRRSTCIV